jgi:hypothetical protein
MLPSIFWYIDRRFRRAYFFHHQGGRSTYQKTAIFILLSVRTRSLALFLQNQTALSLVMRRYGLCMKTAQQYKMTYSLATTNNSNPVPLVQRSVVVITPQNGHTVNGSARTDRRSQHAEVFVWRCQHDRREQEAVSSARTDTRSIFFPEGGVGLVPKQAWMPTYVSILRIP